MPGKLQRWTPCGRGEVVYLAHLDLVLKLVDYNTAKLCPIQNNEQFKRHWEEKTRSKEETFLNNRRLQQLARFKNAKYFTQAMGTVSMISLLTTTPAPSVEFTPELSNFDAKFWTSCQVGSRLFDLNKDGRCRVLSPDVMSFKFSVEDRTASGQKRYTPTLIYLEDDSVMVICGNGEGGFLKSGSRYSIENDIWELSQP